MVSSLFLYIVQGEVMNIEMDCHCYSSSVHPPPPQFNLTSCISNTCMTIIAKTLQDKEEIILININISYNTECSPKNMEIKK